MAAPSQFAEPPIVPEASDHRPSERPVSKTVEAVGDTPSVVGETQVPMDCDSGMRIQERTVSPFSRTQSIGLVSQVVPFTRHETQQARNSPSGYNCSIIPITIQPTSVTTTNMPNDKLSDNGALLSNNVSYGMTAQQPQPLASPPTTATADDNDASCAKASPEMWLPTCYPSICSEPVIDWVSHEIGVTDFIATARRLMTDVLSNETLKKRVPPHRTPEPEPALAWTWVAAFFDKGLDSVFGLVHRPSFEARLRAHFESGDYSEGDLAWYALRNTVYATGCRIVVSGSNSHNAFNEARTQSWPYFENALSAHTDLLFSRSDMTTIQAFLAMAFYAEGLGSPAIEFLLASNAMRLAQAKGMHHQVMKSWKMHEEDVQILYWLWWCIYCYDKYLAYRSGRPSAIDDDDISTPIPTSVPEGSTINPHFFQHVIRHAQISSEISKRLYTVKAKRQTPHETLLVVKDLEARLHKWRESLPSCFQSSPPFKNLDLPPNTHLFHVIYLHFSYYGSLITIHTAFCYPWSRPSTGDNRGPNLQAQRQQSLEVVADASRKIIVATQRLEVSAASPVWLTFYYPLTGLINLFIYILQNPTQPTVNEDLPLMEVIVGHFGYLEYASNSELLFPFPREIVSYARMVVKHAREGLPISGAFRKQLSSITAMDPSEQSADHGPQDVSI
ncbi:uncharacterized protein A1O5_04328 [Cladophialophora psammophila CBS 110553]|uniref:Xylanolytic transcriptional activator regulatory domain-containing protein n=1 Tax=Cladophialophora psammophila CBS 110553 TaxID=1182543 RepID=W9WUH1_9EURO|nr:uncharacterized protein A1O5_04328 [Cladophialophora psammophila CBS 110553]EXJ71827.1 hypothetical protein A1O5_04328 [Cladophialophora psammophila CBS 110553]